MALLDFIKKQAAEAAKKQAQGNTLTKSQADLLSKIIKQTPVKPPTQLVAPTTPAKPPTDRESAYRNLAKQALGTVRGVFQEGAEKERYIKQQLKVPSFLPYSEIKKKVPEEVLKQKEAEYYKSLQPIEQVAPGQVTKAQALEQIYLQDQAVTKQLRQEQLAKMSDADKVVDKMYKVYEQAIAGVGTGLTGLPMGVDSPEGIIEKIASAGGNLAGFILGLKGVSALTPKAVSLLGSLVKGPVDFTLLQQAHQFARNESFQQHIEAMPKQALEGLAYSLLGIAEVKLNLPKFARVPAAAGVWTGIAKLQGASTEDAIIQGTLMGALAAFGISPSKAEAEAIIKRSENILGIKRNATPRQIQATYALKSKGVEPGSAEDLNLQASKAFLLNQNSIPQVMEMFKEQRLVGYDKGIQKGIRPGIEKPAELPEGLNKVGVEKYKQLEQEIKEIEALENPSPLLLKTLKEKKQRLLELPRRGAYIKQTMLPEETSLLQEAKKYKSAEEFVSKQPIAYHGSRIPLKKFSNKKGGIFFTSEYADATGYSGGLENVYEGYLNFKKPLEIDAKGAKWDNLNTKYGKSTQEIVSNAEKDGYDGIIFKNIVDNIMDTEGMGESTVYYAYKPQDAFLNESQLTDIWNKANQKLPTTTAKPNYAFLGGKEKVTPEELVGREKKKVIDELVSNSQDSKNLKDSYLQQEQLPKQGLEQQQDLSLIDPQTGDRILAEPLVSSLEGKEIKLDDTLPQEVFDSQVAQVFKPVKQTRKLDSEMAKSLFSDKELFNDLSGWATGELSTLAPTRAAEVMDGKRFGIWKEKVVRPIQEADKALQVELKTKQGEVKELFKGLNEADRTAVFNVAENKMTDADKILIEKNPKIKETAQTLRKNYDELLDRINIERKAIGKDPVQKRIDYITHYQELSIIDDVLRMVGMSMNDVPNSMLAISMYTKPNSPYFKFAKRRLGELTGRDARVAYESYLEPALRQIHFSKPIKNARDILEYRVAIPSEYQGGKIDKVSLVGMKYPNAYKYWTNYLNTVTGKREILDKLFPTASQIMGVTSRLFAPGSIGGNLSTVFTQMASLRDTVADTGLFALKGQLLINIPKWYKFFSKNSRIGLGRQYEVPQTGKTFLGSKKLSSILSKVSDVISIPVAAFDREMVGGAFLSGYFKGKALGLSEKEAILYADDVAERTQASANLIDRPPVNRGKIKTGLGQFQTFVYNEYSLLKKDIIQKIIKGELSKQGYGEGLEGIIEGRSTGVKRLTGFLLATIALSAVYDTLGLPNPFKQEDAKLPFVDNSALNRVYGYIVNQIPGVSSVRFGGAPIFQAGINGVIFLTGSESEKSSAETKLKALGFRLFPGGGQLQKTLGALEAMQKGGKVYSKSGKTLNFTIDTNDIWNVAKAFMFGKWQSNEGQAYLEKLRTSTGKSTKKIKSIKF